jgi:hypothetical protein
MGFLLCFLANPAERLRLAFEQIANFRQELYLLRGSRGRRRLFLFQFVYAFDRHEDDERDNEKIQDDCKKLAPTEHGSLLFRICIGEAGGHLPRQRRVVVREV